VAEFRQRLIVRQAQLSHAGDSLAPRFVRGIIAKMIVYRDTI